jgi:HK97 gp10 family phage protein
MAGADKFQVTGIKETLDVFQQLRDEIGDKKANSRVLLPAMKEAMQRVAAVARMLAPTDTGMLKKHIGITARRPTTKDKKSQYVSNGDVAIAVVSTQTIPKEWKQAFNSANKGVKGSERVKAKKAFLKVSGMKGDGRAMASEFGTAEITAQPFMRPALESQAQSVVNTLGTILKSKIEQYRSKNIK